MRDVLNSRKDPRKRLPPNPLLLTFDDGYLDNHDTALPILARAGVPATFFIPTSYPEAGKLFWWDRVALLVNRCRRDTLDLRYPLHALIPTGGEARGSAIAVLHRIVKRTPNLDLDRFWVELEHAAGVTIGATEERNLAARTIMSFRHVRAMRDAGMSIESHSHAHRVLATLTRDEAVRDLARSREILHEVLGEAPCAVAYPVGHSVSGTHHDVARHAGFDLGFTNATGLCSTGADPMNLPRVSMDRSRVGALYKLALLFGEPNPVMKHRFNFGGFRLPAAIGWSR
jgi:peptidoglycan/xylan/chitin deacetylase (PgdA/CDA1 family)